MGNNSVQLNLGKIEWLRVLGLSSSGTMPSLVLNGVALPQTDPVYNLEVLLDLQLLLEEQVAVEARRAIAHFHVVHQLHPFLDQKVLFTITHSWSPPEWITLHGATLEENLEASASIKCSYSICSPRMVHVTLLLHNLHSFPVCF